MTNLNYRLEPILENTWHVKAEIRSKCQQTVEKEHNKSENRYITVHQKKTINIITSTETSFSS